MEKKKLLEEYRKERIEKKVTAYFNNALKINVPPKVIDILRIEGYIPLLEENADELTTLDNYNRFGNHITQDLFKTNNAMHVFGRVGDETSRYHVLASLYLLSRSYDFVLGNESTKYKPKEWAAMLGYKAKQLSEYDLSDIFSMSGKSSKNFFLEKAREYLSDAAFFGNDKKEIYSMLGEINFAFFNNKNKQDELFEGLDNYNYALELSFTGDFDERWCKLTEKIFHKTFDESFQYMADKKALGAFNTSYKVLYAYSKKTEKPIQFSLFIKGEDKTIMDRLLNIPN